MLRTTTRFPTIKGCVVESAGDAGSSSFEAAFCERWTSNARTTTASFSADPVAPVTVETRHPRLRYGLPPEVMALRRGLPPTHVHWLEAASASASNAPAVAASHVRAWLGSSNIAVSLPPIATVLRGYQSCNSLRTSTALSGRPAHIQLSAHLIDRYGSNWRAAPDWPVARGAARSRSKPNAAF